MIAKERGNMSPLLRFGRGEREHCRCHTAGFSQGNNERPLLVGDGILDLFIIVAAVREHNHLTRIIGADILFQLYLLDVLYDEVMLGSVLQLTLPAIALAIERDGTKRNQQVIE